MTPQRSKQPPQEVADIKVTAMTGQGGRHVTITNHPLCIAPGNSAVAVRSDHFRFSDHGYSWELSGRNGFFSPFTCEGLMSFRLVAATRGRPWVIGTTLAGVTATCWAYLFAAGAATGSMDSALAMPMTTAWTSGDVFVVWSMWAVMMAAMMLPSATPMMLAYARTVQSRGSSGDGSTPFFVGAYVVVWSGFAVAATGLQWTLHQTALVDGMGVSTSRWLAGPVVVLAGTYQFTRLKHAMLGRCRTPFGFLLNKWHDGRVGAAVMGAHHGILCVGCCWALMGLLFVLGVMNLWWVALLATVVLVEKITRSDAVPRVLGAAMLLWGAFILIGL